MKKHGEELTKDTGKWIDHSVWHGKAHTWDKIKWLIGEVDDSMPLSIVMYAELYVNCSGRKPLEADHSS